MALTIKKAKTANVAACTVFRQSHVGRLAAYPMMAMRKHDRACHRRFRPLAQTRRTVGGREARSAPIDFDRRAVGPRGSVLSGHGDVGGGRRKDSTRCLARRRNPTGWIVDSEGRQTTDPRQFRKGGALLPLGAPRVTRAAAWLRWSRCCAAS